MGVPVPQTNAMVGHVKGAISRTEQEADNLSKLGVRPTFYLISDRSKDHYMGNWKE